MGNVLRVLIGIIVCTQLSGCVSESSSLMSSVSRMETSSRGIDTCLLWPAADVARDDIEVAADSTLEAVAKYEADLGMEHPDLNLELPPETFAALCLIAGPIPQSLGYSRILYYQLENGGNLVLASD